MLDSVLCLPIKLTEKNILFLSTFTPKPAEGQIQSAISTQPLQFITANGQVLEHLLSIGQGRDSSPFSQWPTHLLRVNHAHC